MRLILLFLYMMLFSSTVVLAENNAATYSKAAAIYEKWIPKLPLSYSDSIGRTINITSENSSKCNLGNDECLENERMQRQEVLDKVLPSINEESVRLNFIRATSNLGDNILDNLLNANMDDVDTKQKIVFIYDSAVLRQFLEIMKKQKQDGQ